MFEHGSLLTRILANVTYHSKAKPIRYFAVAEYPSTIQEILYLNAHHLKPDELESTTGLRKGAPLNPIANQIARQAILRRYNDMGRLFAGVELLEGDKPGDTRVVFNISEGPVVKISSIDFVGNTFVNSARLRVQIDSNIDADNTFVELLGKEAALRYKFIMEAAPQLAAEELDV